MRAHHHHHTSCTHMRFSFSHTERWNPKDKHMHDTTVFFTPQSRSLGYTGEKTVTFRTFTVRPIILNSKSDYMFECVKELNWVLLEKPGDKTKGQYFYTNIQMDLLQYTNSKWDNGGFQAYTWTMSRALDQSPQELMLFVVYGEWTHYTVRVPKLNLCWPHHPSGWISLAKRQLESTT